MPLNFPIGPTVGQNYFYQGKYFRWDGVAWKQLNTTKERQIAEYTNYYNVPVASSVTLDVRRYNYFTVTVNSNTAISVPDGQPYSKFILELDYTTLGYNPTGDGYFLETASYDNVSFSVATQETIPLGIAFKPDGTKMYVVGNANDRVHQYTLATPWNIASATYDNVSLLISSQETFPYSIAFKPDGTKMYMVGNNNRTVYQYTLATPWNIATATYDSVSFSVATQETNPYSIAFKPDGTKMYMLGGTTRAVHQYTLATPWNIASATYDSVSFSVGTQEAFPYSIAFKPDGTKMYVIGVNSRTVYQYTLATPWNIASATYDSVSFSVTTQETNPFDIAFKPDGTKMYVIGVNNDTVFQYTTQEPLYNVISWSDNIIWMNGIPRAPFYSSTILIEFVTTDGKTWIADVILNRLE